MKLDWQHVVLALGGLLVVGAVMVLGHGQTLLQVLAALGGVGGLAALLKPSPIAPTTQTSSVTVEVTKPFPDEQPTKKEGRSIPPVQTILLLVGFAIFGARVLVGCAAAAETSYTAQQLQCVDRARTLEESKACRAEVDRAWHVVDGGVQ